MPDTQRKTSWLSRLFGASEPKQERSSTGRRVSLADLQLAGAVAEIQALGELKPGWNTYRAGIIGEDARRRAISFINSLSNLPRVVPAPAVTPTSDGGVALVWHTGPHDVEVIFLERGAEYSVAARGEVDIIDGGSVDQVELLKDVVGKYVAVR